MYLVRIQEFLVFFTYWICWSYTLAFFLGMTMECGTIAFGFTTYIRVGNSLETINLSLIRHFDRLCWTSSLNWNCINNVLTKTVRKFGGLRKLAIIITQDIQRGGGHPQNKLWIITLHGWSYIINWSPNALDLSR